MGEEEVICGGGEVAPGGGRAGDDCEGEEGDELSLVSPAIVVVVIMLYSQMFKVLMCSVVEWNDINVH